MSRGVGGGIRIGAAVSRRSRPRLRFVLATLAALLVATQGWAEEPPPEAAPPPPLPIAASDIPARSAAEASSLRATAALLERSASLDQIAAGLGEREAKIAQDFANLRRALQSAASLDTLDEIEREWREFDRPLDNWAEQLGSQTGVFEQEIRRLETSVNLWERTIQGASDERAPNEIVALARDTFENARKARNDLGRLRDRTLGLLGQVGHLREAVQEALARIENERQGLLTQLVRREADPLWSQALREVSVQDLRSNVRQEIERQVAVIASVCRSEADRVVFQLLLLIAIGLLLRGMRGRIGSGTMEDTIEAPGIAVLERPFSLALLLTLLATPWLYVSTPPAMNDLVGLLLILPVLRLVLPLVDAPMRPPLLGLGALYVVDKVRDLVEAAPVAARLLFIVEMIAALAIVGWVLHSAREPVRAGPQPVDRWRAGVGLALRGALLVVSVAALAAVAGFVRLGVLLGSGTLQSAYLAVFLLAVVRVGGAALGLAARSRIAQTLRAVRDRRDTIVQRSKSALRIAALAAWALATLDLFALLDPIQYGLRAALLAKLEAGALSLSLADVLAFGGTILAAVFLARLITTLLDEDVYPRVGIGRGGAYAISTIVRYGVLLLGFLVAVGAMGLGMDRITVLLGAFGVGLGFGLQNVVNNFVSGLILIFERPVQVGDAVEVGSVKGKVSRIGIRSSTVRTFDGADVTLPNGTLLSEALTNWTKSDRVRRLEIAVGVAYGTDPDAVIEVLREAEDRQPGLVDDPAPQVLFKGFGESSLDFLLRAWVDDNDRWVMIQSELALAVNRGLRERDIEIPFPQRDVNLPRQTSIEDGG